VGLGKTIIACLIAKLLNKRGIILCPPGIMGDEKYINANKIPPNPPLPIITPPVKTLIHKQEIKNIKENITKINIVLFLFDTL